MRGLCGLGFRIETPLKVCLGSEFRSSGLQDLGSFMFKCKVG